MELIILREILFYIPCCKMKTAPGSSLPADWKQIPYKGCKTLPRLPPPLLSPLCLLPLCCHLTATRGIKGVWSLGKGTSCFLHWKHSDPSLSHELLFIHQYPAQMSFSLWIPLLWALLVAHPATIFFLLYITSYTMHMTQEKFISGKGSF